jgi:hypothetical protein
MGSEIRIPKSEIRNKSEFPESQIRSIRPHAKDATDVKEEMPLLEPLRSLCLGVLVGATAEPGSSLSCLEPMKGYRRQLGRRFSTQRREGHSAAKPQPKGTAEYAEYAEKRGLRPQQEFVAACEQIRLLQCRGEASGSDIRFGAGTQEDALWVPS